ncbi:MAG: hypothetical protein SFW09_04630 [Hyphomicrobiaceae bacterium]|nr:hypothetical protein [Hyphomicrobiaceae bacterium]
MRAGWVRVRATSPVLVGVASAFAVAGGPAVAASAQQLFPVRSGLVPLVVAATFMLPALLAGVLSVARRAARSPGVLGLGALVAAAAALLLYARPDLLTVFRV